MNGDTMKKELTWQHTQYACYMGYITQAIIVNLPALLFVTFRTHYDISLTQLSLLVVLLFVVQIAVDMISAPVVDKIGYRIYSVGSFLLSCTGLVLMSVLPMVMEDTYAALLIAVTVASAGSGMLEVIISPINDSLPRPKDGPGAMSLLHSFYCWGVVAVVLLSTVYFSLFGTENWMYLPVLWAFIPLVGLLAFFKVPLYPLVKEGKAMPLLELLRTPMFWALFLFMICAGASEQAMSQWASLFAETGLGVSKSMGDLMGPCAFAVCMGTARVLFGVYIKWPVHRPLVVCGILCIFCYLLVILSPWPVLSLIGCALCGFSVGVMWPGTYSLASSRMPLGGTAMYALLAMGGDIGCSLGPAAVGAVTDAIMENPVWMNVLGQSGDAVMKVGFAFAIIFPLCLAVGVTMFARRRVKAA